MVVCWGSEGEGKGVEEEVEEQEQQHRGKGMMIEDDNGILHEEKFACEFRRCMPVCWDGEAVRHFVVGGWLGFVPHLGSVGSHGSACVDIWLSRMDWWILGQCSYQFLVLACPQG